MASPNRTAGDRPDASRHPVRLLAPGDRLVLAGPGEVRIETVHQRNWSRVATAVGADGSRWFCKQFVDRIGVGHPRGYAGELETRETLGPDDLPGVRIVPVAGLVPDRLTVVSPYVHLETIDSVGYAWTASRCPSERVGRVLADLLEARTVPDANARRVRVWKGLDPKNVGWDDDGAMWVFDFGPPVELPVETAAGQVVAAGLLSRWVARPGLHLVWPERSILRGVCRPVAAHTSFEEVDRRLRQNHELRVREPQRTGVAATATRAGLHTLGHLYWATARREARRLFDA